MLLTFRQFHPGLPTNIIQSIATSRMMVPAEVISIGHNHVVISIDELLNMHIWGIKYVVAVSIEGGLLRATRVVLKSTGGGVL